MISRVDDGGCYAEGRRTLSRLLGIGDAGSRSGRLCLTRSIESRSRARLVRAGSVARFSREGENCNDLQGRIGTGRPPPAAPWTAPEADLGCGWRPAGRESYFGRTDLDFQRASTPVGWGGSSLLKQFAPPQAHSSATCIHRLFCRSLQEASPRGRGWTRPSYSLWCGVGGFPAWAGMDPGTPGTDTAQQRLPRVGGDGPPAVPCPWRVPRASPRGRGWTRSSRTARSQREGFPAWAGMDPPSALGRQAGHRLPRVGGDGPVAVTATV